MEKVTYNGVEYVLVPANLLEARVREHFNIGDGEYALIEYKSKDYYRICERMLSDTVENMFHLYWRKHAENEREYNEIMLQHDEALRSKGDMSMDELINEFSHFIFDRFSEDGHEE